MKLKTVDEIAANRKNALDALRIFFSSPQGRSAINVLENELGIDSLIGSTTHETYLRLGKNEVLVLLKQLGGLND